MIPISPHNIQGRISSWTQEDDELFEQLMQDLSLDNEQHQNHSEINFSKIREELNSTFLKDLSTGSENKEQPPPEKLLERGDDLPENKVENVGEKKEEAVYDSFREWLEANRKIIYLEKEEDELHLLDLFVAHKEREILKKMISFSDSSDGNRLKKIFFRKESNVMRKPHNMKNLVSESPYDSLLSGDSSSDEEDNSSIMGHNPILIFNDTSGSIVENQQTTTKSHRVYSTSKYIDKYHEGTDFYEHLKDIIVGGDLESGNSVRAVAQLNKTRQKIESFFGIDMSEESWIHFKNYIRKIVLDYTNQEVRTESGNNLTELSEADFLKELYPISNEKNIQKDGKWKENTKQITSYPKSKDTRRRMALSKVKALKLLYGSSGYAESLLVDNFPPIHFLEFGYPIFSKQSTPEEKKAAIENEMRNLELKLVNSSSKGEFKWIEYLIDYLKNPLNNNIPINVLDDMGENQWKDLEELVDNIGKRLETFNTYSEIPKVFEIPNDQLNISKPQIVEEPIPKDFPLENRYENMHIPVNSWKNALSYPLDLENNKNTSEEVKDIKKQIQKRGFSVNSFNNENSSSLVELQNITGSDTDELTTFSFTKDNPLFKLKNPILTPLANKYKQIKNGIVKSTVGFKFFSVSPSDTTNDWEVATKLNQYENSASPYSLKLSELYSFIVSKSHISTRYALIKTRKITNLFFKGNENSIEISSEALSKKGKQTYHEIMWDDAKHASLEENAYNNKLKTINDNQSQDKQNGRDDRSTQQHIHDNMEGQNSTASTHYLSNTFSIDGSVWQEGDLIQLSKGVDVVKEVNAIRNSCIHDSFTEFSKIVKLPEGFDANQMLYSRINNSVEVPQKYLPRVCEIQEQRFDKLSLLHLEQTVVQLEKTIATKALSGVEPSEEEKKTLQILKHKLEDERKRLENVIYTDTMSPLEQSKLEQLGIYQQSIKLITSTIKLNNRESAKDLIEMERYMILDREFRVLDQLLDQMNREQRREVLSFKPAVGENTITQQHQEAIKNYSKLRSYYNQIARKDSSLREWQSLTLKEKISFEKEFRKQSKNDSYENVIYSVSRIIQSAQFAETFSFISTALSKKIESRNHNSELAKLLVASSQKEKIQIRNFTREFIQKNGIDQRYKSKLLSKHRKLDFNDKQLREVFNYENYSESIMVNQLDNTDSPIQFKLLSDIINNEVTKDELYSIISHQCEIQKLFKKERLTISKKSTKKSTSDSILTVEESKEDPLFGIIQTPLDYLTLEQLTYFRKLFEESMVKKLKEWREKTEQSAGLFVSPHYLKKDNAIQLDTVNDNISKYEKLTSKVFDINGVQIFSNNQNSIIPVFPEVPWQGSFKDLQLLYVKMQLERSNNPNYTRSVLEFNNNPERFLQRSFWKGVWMLPESLSNFIFTSDPTPLIKILPPSQPKHVDKKPSPVVTPSQPPPLVTPILPTIPVPTIQTPPPPLTENILPPQIPSIPRIQIPIQRPTIQPPTLPIIQPPSQPTVIPQRSPVLVHGTPIYPRYLLENLNRRLFQ